MADQAGNVAASAWLAAMAFALGSYLPVRIGAPAAVALATAVILLTDSLAGQVPIIVGTAGPYALGQVLRRRRELTAELARRNAELEAEEQAFSELAVRHERARIARDLHDIVAHHLAVMAVQAGAGRMSASRNGATRERLDGIRAAGESALVEIDRLVGLLDPGELGSDAREDRLQGLVEGARAAGLSISVEGLAADVDLPSEVEEVAVRLVQEGLTNAIKHAPGTTVRVRLTRAADALEIEVRDTGASATPTIATSGSGLGLEGMTDRIQALRGSVESGPGPDGGWRILARLPLGGY